MASRRLLALTVVFLACGSTAISGGEAEPRPAVLVIQPPEKNFFSKQLRYQGIPIKAHEVVSDEALYAAYDRLSMMLAYLPMVVPSRCSMICTRAELQSPPILGEFTGRISRVRLGPSRAWKRLGAGRCSHGENV